MKNIVILTSLMLTTWMTQAQTLSDLITNCSKEPDSLKRLVCYDNVAAKAEKPLPVAQSAIKPTAVKEISPPSTSLSTSSASPTISESLHSEKKMETSPESVDQFGMEYKTAREQTEDKIYANVKSIAKGHRGKLSVILDNGQSWKQTDSSSIRLKAGERLYIERGALGSFFMSTEKTSRRIRVKRTK